MEAMITGLSQLGVSLWAGNSAQISTRHGAQKPVRQAVVGDSEVLKRSRWFCAAAPAPPSASLAWRGAQQTLFQKSNFYLAHPTPFTTHPYF
jgi:hypothetical protein